MSMHFNDIVPLEKKLEIALKLGEYSLVDMKVALLLACDVFNNMRLKDRDNLAILCDTLLSTYPWLEACDD